MRNIYFFIGTTAELLKLFPVIRELEKRKINFKIITSGQTDINFNEVASWIEKKKPDIELIKKSNQSSITLFILWSLKTIFLAPLKLRKEFVSVNKNRPIMIVHGDTVSSLLGTLVAKLYGIKVIHIESGLRSYNFLEPFPEELTRFVISKFADVHFAPNKWSMSNLSNAHGIKINTYQNTFIESLSFAIKKKDHPKKPLKGKYFVFILHRQEHVVFGRDESKQLVEYILDISQSELTCVFIKHSTNEKFLKTLNPSVLKQRKIDFVSRLPYSEFLDLIKNSEFIITDGGGNQEEAYYLGIPCLIIRKHTERIEGLGGNALLLGSNKKRIDQFLKNYKSYRRPRVEVTTRPSKIIVDYLENNFKV
jgi:UDP-N-acetylglucosamine 2-epimerase (non-hydrolysing)